MAVPYQVQNLQSQQTDGNILLTWNGSLGATTYQVQKSTDNVNFVNFGAAIPGIQLTDPYPGVGIQFFYQVIAINGSGNAPASTSVGAITAPPGEMSLYELRQRSQQRADLVNSAFVTNSEWNFFIRLASYELYDLLITSYEDYGIYTPGIFINTQGTTMSYALPDGATNYKGGTFGGGSGNPAPAFYKLRGVDLGVNTSNNAWVTLRQFNWENRNDYVYPNSTSTIYGVFNMRYRVMGGSIFFIPTPAGNQQVRIWYAPRLPGLLADTDLTTLGQSGWLAYVIARAAKYALDKQESDSSKLDAEILFLKNRIEESASNRNAGVADTIADTRRDPIYGGGSTNNGGSNGGW